MTTVRDYAKVTVNGQDGKIIGLGQIQKAMDYFPSQQVTVPVYIVRLETPTPVIVVVERTTLQPIG